MIIGLRILSNNLSGQTANVTFFPVSGGTIDLGEQTIPFNYLNPNPYGTYEFYVPLYDYTYELVVSEPTLPNQQSFAVLGRLTGDTNMWALGNLNYNDFTSQVIDLNIDHTDWEIDGSYQSLNAGYSYVFYDRNNSNTKLIVFTDYKSEEFFRYSADTQGNYGRDYLDGFGFYFNDRHNGVLLVSSNAGFNQVNYDPNEQYLYVLNNYDYVTANGSILIQIDTFSSNTSSIQLINSSGVTTVDEFSYLEYQKSYISFRASNAILSYVLDLQAGFYTEINLISQEDGSVLKTQTLPDSTYTFTPVYSFAGKSKSVIIFNQGNNESIPYFMFYHNGENNNSDLIILPRGAEFVNYQILTSKNLDNSQIDSGGILINLWGNYNFTGDWNLGYDVDYCNFVYILGDSDTFTVYNYQDSGTYDKSVNIFNWYILSNSIHGYGNIGDNYYSEITIGNSGVTYYQMAPIGGFYAVDRWGYGNKYINWSWSDDVYSGGTLNLFTESGITDSLFIDIRTPGGTWRSDFGTYGIFVFSTYDSLFYVNNLSTSFNIISGQTGWDSDYYTCYNFWDESGHSNGKIFLLNGSNGETKLITSDSIVDGIVFPINGGYYSFRLGETKFMYIYNLPTWEGNIVIELYDYDFNLLNSITTEYDDWNNIYAVKDRFWVEFYSQEGNREYYLISENEINFITLSNIWTNWQINDSYYYD